MQFTFVERTVSNPKFVVEADSLEAAYQQYRQRSDNGEEPDDEPVNSTDLVSIYQGDDRVPEDQWPSGFPDEEEPDGESR